MQSIIFLLLAPYIINANVKQYAPSSFYPSELQAILSYIDLNLLSAERRKRLEKGLKTIDVTQTLLKKKELLFLIKSCIYKTILANTPTKKIKKIPKKEERAKLLKRFKKEDKKTLFDLWPLESIIVDIENLEKKTAYLNYYNNKKGRFPENFQSYQRKIELLLGWFYFFKNENREAIAALLGKLSEEIIDSLGKQLHFYVHKTKVNFKNDSLTNPHHQLTSFQILNKEAKKTTENTISLPSIEDIIDPIINNEKNILPKPQNDWTFSEYNEAENIRNPTNDWVVQQEMLPKNVTKNIITRPASTSEIESEDNLPKPLNDWILPTIDPFTELPKPTNDWAVFEEKTGPN